jgi:membrane fusion protein (multidrug efflux system)
MSTHDMIARFTIGALVMTAIVLLAACNKPDAPQAAQQQQPPPPEVSVVKVHAETLPITRELAGRLAASRVAEVRARVAGIVLEREYTEGTDVRQGAVLFRIDPAPLRAALLAQEAALARAQADANNANDIARRYTELQSKGLISKQDLDNALASQRSTSAAVKQAEANLEAAQLDLNYATVEAPLSGRAGRAQVDEGALVGQGEATVLTTIEQIDPIYVNFSQTVAEFEQLQQSLMAQGGSSQKTSVEVIQSNGEVYPRKGEINFTEMAVDPSTGAVSLRAVVPNPDRRLLPGMFVKLRLTTGQVNNAYKLPQAAVSRDPRGAFLLVVDESGTVQQRRVELKSMTVSDWIVTGDIKPGDQVIVAGLQKVQPGAPAKPVPADAKPAGAPPAQHS